MASQVICHAIGGPGSFSAGLILKAAELAFSAISDNRPALFASSYQDLGGATGELRARRFGSAA
jgi:hypothetical protein